MAKTLDAIISYRALARDVTEQDVLLPCGKNRVATEACMVPSCSAFTCTNRDTRETIDRKGYASTESP